MTDTDIPDDTSTDVLVIGGGPAGTWAAVSAAERGARVTLVDKGYCGTSGATASGGNNLWLIPPGPERESSIRQRQHAGGALTDAEWMHRVLDTCWQRIADLAAWGYPFPVDDHGRTLRSSLQGPEYMRRMRRKVHRSGVRILDHHPALSLLIDDQATVRGATGIARQHGGRTWRIRAGAVVIASGGYACLSGGFGTNVDTGEGLLMSVEAGAELSGMEFSTTYALAPQWGVHTKGRMLEWGSFYDDNDRLITDDEGKSSRRAALQALTHGHRVFARLDRAPKEMHQLMRAAQPNYFLPLNKAGIDPFTTAYPIRMIYEGTVRGTGGLRLTGLDCATTVTGLYAAGDAATRELVTGSISGGGSHNGAWAIASGSLAGRAAEQFARSTFRPTRIAPIRPAVGPNTGIGLHPGARTAPTAHEVIGHVQSHILPPERTFLRSEAQLRSTSEELATAWNDVAGGLAPMPARERYKSREAIAILAAARWITAAALARAESRGMHRRSDHPDTDRQFDTRILTGGLGEVWTRPDPVLPVLLNAEGVA